MNSNKAKGDSTPVGETVVKFIHDARYNSKTQLTHYALNALPTCSVYVIALTLLYIVYRLKCILDGQNSSAWLEIVVAWSFFVIELAFAGESPKGLLLM